MIDSKQIDYEKLAIAIINEYETDREEAGRKEIRKGMKYVLDNYTGVRDREIIDEMLITFTGWSLVSLLEISEEVSDDELY